MRSGGSASSVAVDHLSAAGLTVLERNWRCREGELDIVARDGPQLVFVEVKTRSSLAFGSPAEAVDRRKAARIRQLARALDGRAPRRPEPAFWVVGPLRRRLRACARRPAGDGVDVDHLVGAF